MQLVSVKCPNCGARVKTDDGQTQVTCEYCGTEARVELRTGVLELTPPRRRGASVNSSLPVATQVRSSRWFGLLVAAVVGIPLVIGGLMYAIAGMVGVAPVRLWQHVGPFALLDIDDDGTPDPIGLVLYPIEGEGTHIAAVSGVTGEALWETESLGKWRDVASGYLVADGDAVLRVDNAARVAGFSAATGKALWKVQLPEKPKRFCKASDARKLAVETVDGKWVELGLSDGQVDSIDPVTECNPVSTRHVHQGAPGTELLFRPQPPDFGTLHMDRAYRRVGSKIVISVGTRAKDTQVPMLGAYRIDDAEVMWETDVPASNPLGTDSGSPTVVIDDNHVLASYRVGDIARIALFKIRDGNRVWDVEVPSGSWRATGLGLTDTRAFVAASGLFAFDVATGKLQFSVGLP